MDYTFQEDDDAARRRTLLGAIAFVLAVFAALVLVASCGKRRNRAQDESGSDAPATTESTMAGRAGRLESAAQQTRGTARNANGGPAREPGASGGAAQPEANAARQSATGTGTGKPPSEEARALIGQGQDAERRDDLAAARSAYEKALACDGIGNAKALAESRLGDIMVKLITSQREMPEKAEHAIVKGDLIAKLAGKYGTTVELISLANGISNPNNIKIGDRLRILDHAKFEIFVSKSENWLLVKMNGKFFKRYSVGTGRYNRTPVGTFKVVDKIKEPSWWKDNVEIPYGDERNILGTRWMAIAATGSTPPAKGYGIHGTWDNSSLGHQSSAGCVRMANEDVEELFIYIPKGTPVTIAD